MIKFNTTPKEAELIEKIVDRFVDESSNPVKNTLVIEMDITACHCNGCLLDLEGLLNADDFTFFHDVMGIRTHINRRTGKIEREFRPRTAK